MSTYELQAHSRYLDLTVVDPALGIARHTGYDLIERDSFGTIVSIKSIFYSLFNVCICNYKVKISN